MGPAGYEGIRVKRILSYLIDVLVVAALVIAWWLVGAIFSVLTFFMGWPLIVLGAVLLPIAYHTYFIGAEQHQTLGMRALGIRVAMWDGGDPSYPQALLQTLLFYATVPTTHGLILLVSLFNPQGRCLHDILCGTTVVSVVEGPSITDARSRA